MINMAEKLKTLIEIKKPANKTAITMGIKNPIIGNASKKQIRAMTA